MNKRSFWSLIFFFAFSHFSSAGIFQKSSIWEPQNKVKDPSFFENDPIADSIQKAILKFEDAWNKHDARLFALVFSKEADFTNVFGQSMHGREAIEKYHAPLFSSIFKLSHLVAGEKSVRFIKPDVAEVDVRWTMSGAVNFDGSPWADRKGLLNLVMVPEQGSWNILIMHNMDLPEIPVPVKK